MNVSRSIQASLAAGAIMLAAARAFANVEPSTGAEPEEKIYAGPEIVVTATRIEWPVEKTASFITVISRSDIEQRHAESVADLLRSVVGLSVVQSGSAGKIASIFMRGANSNHVLVMLDGVPLNDPTTGAFDFSELSCDNIERIEIVRGPHGILYGSAAIGGVVNIITGAKAEGPGRSVSLAAGSFRSAGGAVSLSGGEGSYRYSYTLSGETTEGPATNDFYETTAFSGSVSNRLTATSNVRLSLRYREAASGLRGQWFAPDPNATQDGGHFLVSALYRQFISDRWSYSVRTSFLSREITWDDPVDALDTDPFAGDGFSETNSRARDVALQNDLRFSESVWLVSGAEWKEEQTTNSGYSWGQATSFDDRIRNASLFANGIFDFRGIPTTSIGVRVDDHSKFGSVATYKLSLSYPVPGIGATLKGSIGTGFRAPSLNELYYPNYGNPDLAPERTSGYDVGAARDFASGKASFECAWFDNSYRDMIAFNQATWLAGNIGKAKSSGVEIRSSLRPFAALTLQGFYTFTRTEDCETGKLLLRRPRHSGGGSVSYRNGPFDVLLSASRVGARFDSYFRDLHTEYLFDPAYTRLDAAVTLRTSAASEVYLTVGNAANERYDEVAGYPAPGRRFTLGTKVDF
ncbi:MAG: TonB-dependent receptor [Candidatus Krumholzibacteria bacterium]|nr:TonB-dependent receptor [Candidatus Krumholzibacteria bacterium]